MPTERELADFLEKERLSTLTSEAIFAALLWVGGVLATVVTYGIVYGASWFVIGDHAGRTAYQCIAWGTLAAIFLRYPRHDAERLSVLVIDTVDGKPPWRISLPGGTLVSNLNLISPKTTGSFAKIFVQIATIAPAALFGAWRCSLCAYAASQADARACAPALAFLLGKGTRVSYDELAVEAGRTPASVFSVLLLLNLAQHLPGDPVGMVILTPIRERLSDSTIKL